MFSKKRAGAAQCRHSGAEKNSKKQNTYRTYHRLACYSNLITAEPRSTANTYTNHHYPTNRHPDASLSFPTWNNKSNLSGASIA